MADIPIPIPSAPTCVRTTAADADAWTPSPSPHAPHERRSIPRSMRHAPKHSSTAASKRSPACRGDRGGETSDAGRGARASRLSVRNVRNECTNAFGTGVAVCSTCFVSRRLLTTVLLWNATTILDAALANHGAASDVGRRLQSTPSEWACCSASCAGGVRSGQDVCMHGAW